MTDNPFRNKYADLTDWSASGIRGFLDACHSAATRPWRTVPLLSTPTGGSPDCLHDMRPRGDGLHYRCSKCGGESYIVDYVSGPAEPKTEDQP